jgi:hypothetical protein
MLILSPDGAITQQPIPGNDRGLLAALYIALDASMVETITLSPELTMWADEEALLKRFPVLNLPAGRVAAAHGQTVRLCGAVAFTGGHDLRGATLALTDAQAEAITSVTAAHRAPAVPGAASADDGTVR